MYVVFSCFMRDKFLFQGHGFEFFEQGHQQRFQGADT